MASAFRGEQKKNGTTHATSFKHFRTLWSLSERIATSSTSPPGAVSSARPK